MSPRNGHGTQPSKNDTNTDSFLAFIDALFGECEGPVNLCTLRNGAGGAGKQITSGDPEALKKYVIKYDEKDWGV